MKTLPAISQKAFFSFQLSCFSFQLSCFLFAALAATAQHCPQAGMMPPAVTTGMVTFVSGVSATVTGNVTNDGGGTVTHRGMVWATTPNPTTADALTNDGTGTGNFTGTLTGLVPGTTYHVRAFAANATATVYGAEVTLTTAVAPTVSTTAVTAVTGFTASTGGNVTASGGDPVTARGVCWATSPNPTTTENTLAGGSGTGSFTSNLTGLTPSTTYYLRAYATNTAGTGYGQQEIFTTTDGLPTVTTTPPASVSYALATLGGIVASENGASVSLRGVCYALAPNPTTADNTTVNGLGTGTYSTVVAGLTHSTTYYVRAYATNAAGTGYGDEYSFTTEVGETGISQHTCGTEGVHNPDLTYGTMTDQEGNVYKTIVIGTQVWMAENLRTSTYRNGEPILIVTSASEASDAGSTETGAIAYYNYSDSLDCPYGRLYNWFAVNDDRDVCPLGWHVPTDIEWTELTDHLGGQSVAGGKMKSIVIWDDPNGGASNESGFSGLPGGLINRCVAGGWVPPYFPVGILQGGGWWTSSSGNNFLCNFNSLSGAWQHGIRNSEASANKSSLPIGSLISVRCIRD